MRPGTLFLVLACCAGSLFSRAQQTPKTLLWRISGNGFTKPCYLYGTMHSKDKRVYYLGDSVYSSIKFCDGFALELDPGEMIDTLINNIETDDLNVAYRQTLENSLVKKSPEYYKSRRQELDSIYNKLRQRYNDLSPREIARLEKAYRRRDKNDMNTRLDLYLFDIAKRQGKVVGGIEDITDQTSLKDELGNSFDPDLFLKNQRKKYVDVEEWMISNYTEAELDKLHEFSKQVQSERQMSLVLYNRNDKMCRRIDSLGKIRSTFCAVGAGHLPGDSGVISLLRKKGYSVDPVFSSKKIEPGDLKIDNRLQMLTNISDPDSNYSVQMPGKPTMLTPITNKLFVKTYKELSNEIMLMCGLYEDGNIDKTIDKEVEEIKKYFSRADIKLYSTNKITRQELAGYEVNFKNSEGYIRMHLFNKNGKIYMFAIGSKDRDSLNSVRCQQFLSTYRINLNKQQAQTEMISFASPDKAFSILMPGMPKKDVIPGDLTYTKEDVTLFSGVDTKKKINYLVLLKEPFKGYFIEFDSTVFTQTFNDVIKDVTQKVLVEENILLDDHPALKVKIRGQADGKTHVIYSVSALRHNRFYNLTARALALPGNEQLFDEFIRSFRFLPYLATAFEKQTWGDNLFSVSAPSPISIMQTNTGNTGKRTDYYAYDSSTAMSYGITALALDKLYWTDSKNTLLNDYARIHFNDSLAVDNMYGPDSLIYKKTVFNGNIEGRELLLKTMASNSYSRIRLMHYADSVFVINLKGDKALVTDNNADLFFNSFRFINEHFTSHAFTTKTDLLITDLQSEEAVKRNAAAIVLKNGYRFPASELPKMMKALLYNYGNTSIGGTNITSLLGQAITPYTGEDLFSFIKQNYPALRGKREDLRMQMFHMLAASKNASAYQLLKNLLLTDPPANADYEPVLASLMKAPSITKDLFPDIAAKFSDESLAPFIAGITAMLIDSNQVQFSSVKSYEDDIYRLAKRTLRSYQEKNNEKYSVPFDYAILELLAKINQKQARSVLSDLIELQNYHVSGMIIKALAKNNQPVPVELTDWYSKTPARRIELYDAMLKIGKQSFFKGEYANQRSFADAFVRIFTDSEIPENIQKYYDLVSVKEAPVNSGTSRFYIFKVTCQFRRGPEYYTCFVGAFSPNDAELSIKEEKEFYILYRTPYDPKNTDKLFDDFIDKVRKMN